MNLCFSSTWQSATQQQKFITFSRTKSDKSRKDIIRCSHQQKKYLWLKYHRDWSYHQPPVMSLWSLLCIICVLLNQTVLVDCRCSGQIYCPPSWLAFKDNCYLLARVKYNYHAAEQHCQSLSERGRPAHLVSILDEEENQFVTHYGNDLWIGYNDLDVEGVYT